MQTNDEVFNSLSSAIWRMVDSFRRGFSQVVDPVRVGVLQLVAAEEGTRPTEIAVALDVIPSSVTRHIQVLQEGGLVSTITNPDDARSTLIQITSEGRNELNEFHAKGLEVLASVLDGWSARDVAQLTLLLDRLTDSWEEHGQARRRPAKGVFRRG